MTIQDLVDSNKNIIRCRDIISRGLDDYIVTNTELIEKGSHIIGETTFRVYIDGSLICTTPYLDHAYRVFMDPSLITE